MTNDDQAYEQLVRRVTATVEKLIDLRRDGRLSWADYTALMMLLHGDREEQESQ